MKAEKINFDSLTVEQIGRLFPVRIVPYNPDWKTLFEQETILLKEVLGEDMLLNIEHIGSTSVEGLAAKPTIDILVEMRDLSDETKHTVAEKLERIGYGNMRNAEKENAMTFGKGYDDNGMNMQTYHVHIRKKGSTPQDEIYFRNYLRQNPDARDAYAKLKYELAEQYRFNREEYTQGKTEFIIKATKHQKGN